MLGRPCARRTTSSGSNPCSLSHRHHTRVTAGVESIRTPCISNRSALQETSSMVERTVYPGSFTRGGCDKGWDPPHRSSRRHRVRYPETPESPEKWLADPAALSDTPGDVFRYRPSC